VTIPFDPRAQSRTLAVIEDAFAHQLRPLDDQAAETLVRAGVLTEAGVLEVRSDSEERAAGLVQRQESGVAEIRIQGPLAYFRTFDWESFRFRATTGEYQMAVEMAATDPDVDTLFLYGNSPGGTAWGTYELGESVYAARSAVEVVAYSDRLIASGGLWVLSAAHRLDVGRQSFAGSVGAVTVLTDYQKLDERLGLEKTIVRSGGKESIKGDDLAGKITPGLVENHQELIGHIASVFLGALQRNLGLTDAELAAVHNGRLFTPEKAVELKLAHGIHPTYRDAVASLGTSGLSGPADEPHDDDEGDQEVRNGTPVTITQEQFDKLLAAAGGGQETAASAATDERIDAILTAADERDKKSRELEDRLVRSNATLAADRALDKLGVRVTAGMSQAGLRGLLVEVEAAGLEVGGKPAFEVLTAVLAAIPEPEPQGDEAPAAGTDTPDVLAAANTGSAGATSDHQPPPAGTYKGVSPEVADVLAAAGVSADEHAKGVTAGWFNFGSK
jgi:ClpP class serine protease